MNRIGELIKSVSAKPSLVVHLGAGKCDEHELYNAIGPEKLIYVEADRQLADAATDAFINTPHVTVIPCAIASENGPQTLHITNNGRFSSLLLPGKLIDFYPNVEVTNQISVQAMTLSKLCRNEDISKDSDNLLVTEIQGMEKEVFPLEKNETLQKFKWIIIRSSEICLYTSVSETAQSDLVETLQSAGFMVLVFNEDTPPFLNILCVRKDRALENVRLKNLEVYLSNANERLENELLSKAAGQLKLKRSYKKRIKNLEKAAVVTETKLEEALAKIASLAENKGQNSQQIRQLDGAINSKINKLERSYVKITTLEKEKNQYLQQISTLQDSMDADTSELEQAKSQLTALEKEKDQYLQQISTLQDSMGAETSELEQAKSQLTTLELDNSRNLQAIAELNKLIEKKTAELDQTNQTLQINNKLVLKSHADLQDLQLQYKKALQHQDQQHTLLCELKEKLSSASKFYAKLNLKNIILEGELLEKDPSIAIESLTNEETTGES